MKSLFGWLLVLISAFIPIGSSYASMCLSATHASVTGTATILFILLFFTGLRLMGFGRLE